jgi:hypothetical protein
MHHYTRIIYSCIIGSIIVTLLLWLSFLTFNDGWYPTDLLTKNTIIFKYLGKATALTTTILICWSFFLSPGFAWTKRFFATPQNVISTNMVVTKWAFILMFVDPIFLAVNRLPNVPLFINFFGFRITSGSYGIGHNLGLVALLIIVIITVVLKQTWIDSAVKTIFRSFFGLIPFVLICHIFFVRSDISKFLPLAIWIYSWLICAIIAYVYQVFRQLKVLY